MNDLTQLLIDNRIVEDYVQANDLITSGKVFLVNEALTDPEMKIFHPTSLKLCKNDDIVIIYNKSLSKKDMDHVWIS